MKWWVPGGRAQVPSSWEGGQRDWWHAGYNWGCPSPITALQVFPSLERVGGHTAIISRTSKHHKLGPSAFPWA